MIEQLQFSLRTAETPRLPSAWAYRIYGWLMAQLPADTAARLHEQGEHPLSQSLCFDAAAQTSVWTLNLLDEALAAQVRPLLAGCTTPELHGAPLQMEPLGSHSVENGLQLLLAAREDPASRTRLWFRTPCAFKQAGRYAIYPQEFLLLQSLVLHWNTAFPDCQLNDPDALDAILRIACAPDFVGSFAAPTEMRLALEHLSYADLRRSPATWALGCCPVFVTAGSCQPEIPLLVWREDGPFLQELLPGFVLPPKAPVDTAGRSIPAFFLPAGIPCGMCLLLTAVSRYTLPAHTVPLLVVTAVFAALLVGAYNGWRKEGIWLQNGRLTLRWQHGFHLHDICVLCPVPALTAMQSPWAAAVHRTNLTLTFPGGVKCRVRSVKCSELPFLLF